METKSKLEAWNSLSWIINDNNYAVDLSMVYFSAAKNNHKSRGEPKHGFWVQGTYLGQQYKILNWDYPSLNYFDSHAKLKCNKEQGRKFENW